MPVGAIITTALSLGKLVGKTKFGKKIGGKAIGAVGKVLGKVGLGKKLRAGQGAGDFSDLVNDPQAIKGIVEGDDKPNKGGRVVDWIKSAKDEIGPLETDNKVTMSNSALLAVGGLAVAGIVIALIVKK